MKSLNKLKPLLLALVCFGFLVFASTQYTSLKRNQRKVEIREKVLDVLIAKKSKLEKALYSRIYYTRGVAAFVSLNPDISDNEFNQLASEYIKQDKVISSMALSKNCILGMIFPFKNHEAAIGLNLLEHPERKKIVAQTIKRRGKPLLPVPLNWLKEVLHLSATPRSLTKRLKGEGNI